MSKRKAIPVSAERARALLDYDPETGVLRWKDLRGGHYKGAIAGGVKRNECGSYITIKIDQQRYYAHRIIWLLMTGAYPAVVIDHRDGCGTNNAWRNLREATHAENVMNARRHGGKPTGVFFEKRRGKFLARLGKRHLGYFATQDAARQAYDSAARARFGEFVRT